MSLEEHPLAGRESLGLAFPRVAQLLSDLDGVAWIRTAGAHVDGPKGLFHVRIEARDGRVIRLAARP